MSWKKDILEAIAAQQSAIDALLAQQQNDNTPMDADEDFASNQVISKRKYLEAVIKASDIFRADNSISIGEYDTAKAWNYQIVNEESIPIEHWYLINTLCEMVLQRLEIDFNDGELFKFFNDTAFRTSWLFNKTLITRENDKWICNYITKENENNYVVNRVLGFEQNKDMIYGAKLEKINKTISKEKGCKLDLWWDNIGAYNRRLPECMLYLLAKRTKDKNVSFLQVVADTSAIGREKVSWLTKFNIFNIFDKSVDNQNKQNSILSDKIKWYSAGEDVEKTFNMLTITIDKYWEQLLSWCGIEAVAADQKQTLSSEANTYQTGTELRLKSILTKMYYFIEEFNSKFKTNIVLKLNKDIQQVVEEKTQVVPDGNENNNAMKINTAGAKEADKV